MVEPTRWMKQSVLWFMIALYGVVFAGCTEPLISIDASDNTMNVGKYRQDQTINFRSKR